MRTTYFKSIILLFSLILLISFATNAQGLPKKTLLAISKTDHVLAIVDPTTFKTLARIPVGSDPHEVEANTDGSRAYVTIYGGGSLHELNVIDLVAQKALPSVDTSPLYGPHGLIFVNGKAWFSAEGSKSVGRFDPETGKIDWAMGTGQDRTHMIYVTPDGKKVYTTNINSGTVSILTDTLMKFGGLPPPPQNTQPSGNMSPPPNFKPRSDWFQTVIAVEKGSEGFDVSPDGNELWTASADNGIISIIDLKTKKLATKIDAKAIGANRLKITPDGKLAFVSSLRTGILHIVDTKTRKEIKQIKLGKGAAGILMDTDGSRVFVACSADNYIVVIDLKTLEITGKFEVGGNPDGLAWAIRP